MSAKLPIAARIFFGLVFFVFGLNGFLNFLPHGEMPAGAGAFAGALAATGYMFPLIKGTEVVAGVLLLSGRFVPLALTLLAPIVVNIAAFHFVLAPGGGGVVTGVVLVALETYLAWAHRAAYAPLFQAKTTTAAPARRGALQEAQAV
jgi:uncharacterized membrane protein YphA (DoxX/SURF4 family)